MKKIRKFVVFAVMVSLGSLFLISCGTGGDDGGSPYSVLGEINLLRMIAIAKNGSIDISNIFMPITGEVVSTATVTLTNETLGTSEVLTFSPANGWYTVPTNFSIPGHRISVRIEIDGVTITGDSTLTPNPIYSNLGPSSATFPVTASWEVSNSSFEATRTWFQIANNSGTPEGYQAIVPISQTSIQITSAEVSAGGYEMAVVGGNSMNLDGAASGSVIYTTGGGPDFSPIQIF